MQRLRELHTDYKRISDGPPPPGGWATAGEPNWNQLETLLYKAQQHVEHADGRIEKHAAVLLSTQHYTVELGAGRVTHCKSGKDRTGMSASKEQLDQLSFVLARVPHPTAPPPPPPQTMSLPTARHLTSCWLRQHDLRLNIQQQLVLDTMRLRGVRRWPHSLLRRRTAAVG